MFSQQDKDVIRSALTRLTCAPAELTNSFYQHLFQAAPSVRPMFQDDIESQSEKLLDMLVVLVQSLDHIQELVTEIEALGQRHADYGVVDRHYTIVAEVLMQTLAEHVEGWTEADGKAWYRVLDFVIDLMITGARSGRCAVG